MFNYQWEDSEFAESSRKSLEEAENMKESSWRTWGGERINLFSHVLSLLGSSEVWFNVLQLHCKPN